MDVAIKHTNLSRMNIYKFIPFIYIPRILYLVHLVVTQVFFIYVDKSMSLLATLMEKTTLMDLTSQKKQMNSG